MTLTRLRARRALLALISAALAVAAPSLAQACACGCGIFDVGFQTFMPTDTNTGVSAWFRWDYMNQNQNWGGDSKAPSGDNYDKKITTNFYTLGAQYMINRSWTVMAELPTYQRALTTTDDGTVQGPAGSIYTGRLTDLGDLEVMATYTGFSPDLSTGLTFGVKLPTGNYTGPTGPLGGSEFDRDSLPGTGSTDLIVGGYHAGRLTKDNRLSYFVQVKYQAAIMTRDAYRPGNELDAAAGVVYDFGQVGPLPKVAPVLQVLNSYRAHDSQANADPLNSGYERVLIAPGIDMRLNKHLRLFADIAVPVFQHTNRATGAGFVSEGTSGQLVAPNLFKVQLGYDF
jgi:hypothetical protein